MWWWGRGDEIRVIPLLGEVKVWILCYEVDSTQISQPIEVIFEVLDLKDGGLYPWNRHTLYRYTQTLTQIHTRE